MTIPTKPIDLRSDTVTRPSAAMREAMMGAEVGDDVFGEDPTVNALQDRVAQLLGTEASLFVPTGTMANQIAILAHCRPGDDVLIGPGGHSYAYESGGGAALGGVQFTMVGDRGIFTAEEASPCIKAGDHHYAPTTLIVAENSHNRSGGRIFPLSDLQALRSLADDRGLHLHIDGARLLNASVSSGTSPSAYGKAAHSLSLCFSKGLGAPVGSILAGAEAFIDRAHRYRKMLGGGMRQAGILAAAALYALEHHVERLTEDHANARHFAEGISRVPGLHVDLEAVETNIVLFEVDGDASFTAPELQAQADARQLHFFALGPRQVRAVFHLDAPARVVGPALDVLGEAVAACSAAG